MNAVPAAQGALCKYVGKLPIVCGKYQTTEMCIHCSRMPVIYGAMSDSGNDVILSIYPSHLGISVLSDANLLFRCYLGGVQCLNHSNGSARMIRLIYYFLSQDFLVIMEVC